MRSGEAFQVFSKISKIVLEKTGTITQGKPAVVEVVNYDHDKQSVLSYQMNVVALLQYC